MLDTAIQFFTIWACLVVWLIAGAIGSWLFATLVTVVFVAVLTLIAALSHCAVKLCRSRRRYKAQPAKQSLNRCLFSQAYFVVQYTAE